VDDFVKHILYVMNFDKSAKGQVIESRKELHFIMCGLQLQSNKKQLAAATLSGDNFESNQGLDLGNLIMLFNSKAESEDNN
jgi:hypothetical protein